MMMSIYLVVVLIVLIFSSSSSFSISGSSNIISPVRSRSRGGQLSMGNNAKFGIFSPAVIAAKYVIGEAKLNKVLLKTSSLSSSLLLLSSLLSLLVKRKGYSITFASNNRMVSSVRCIQS